MAKNAVLSLIIIFIVVACSQQAAVAPNRAAQLGTELINETFDAAGSWTISATDGLYLNVEDGVYKALLDWRDHYLWGNNGEVHDSAVLEVDVQIAANDRLTQAGIICRSSPQNTGDGYYFLISARGQYAIQRGIDNSSDQLVPFQDSDAIHTDGSVNHLRVVCIGNTLQFFVNDVFLREVSDSSHHRGYASLVIGLPPNASGAGSVTFDNLHVWEAAFP